MCMSPTTQAASISTAAALSGRNATEQTPAAIGTSQRSLFFICCIAAIMVAAVLKIKSLLIHRVIGCSVGQDPEFDSLHHGYPWLVGADFGTKPRPAPS